MQEDKPLASRFENFGAAPSAGVWNNIESQLAQKKKRRLIFWWTSALAASILTGLILFPFFSPTTKASSTQELSKTNQTEKKEANTNNKISINELKNKTEPKIISETSVHNIPLNKMPLKNITSNFKANSNNYSSNKPILEINLPEPDYISVNTPPQPEVVLKEKTELKGSNADSVQKAKNEDVPPVERDPEIEINTVKIRKNRWEVGLFIGAARGNKIFHLPSPVPPVFSTNTNNGSANLQEVNNLDGNINYEQTSLPFQVQAIIGRNLGQKLRLTSGMGLGLYRTKVRLIQPDEFVKSQSTLVAHLPVMLDYKIIDRPKWEWTTGPGILMGYQYVNELYKNHFVTTSLQWQTAIRYNLKDDWSISFQPQYRYRLFDNDTAKTIFYRNHLYGLNLGIVKKL